MNLYRPPFWTKQIDRQSVEGRFSKYGTILGVSLHKDYGYVQFETGEIARKAAMEENKQEFFGSRMGRHLTDNYYGKIPARFKILQILCCKKILKKL